MIYNKTVSFVNRMPLLFFLLIVPFKEGVPSDCDLDDLAGEVGQKWQRLGLRLSISQVALDEIAANEKDKPYRMLLCWRNTTASATHYRDLYNALCHSRVGLSTLAKTFCLKKTT